MLLLFKAQLISLAASGTLKPAAAASATVLVVIVLTITVAPTAHIAPTIYRSNTRKHTHKRTFTYAQTLHYIYLARPLLLFTYKCCCNFSISHKYLCISFGHGVYLLLWFLLRYYYCCCCGWCCGCCCRDGWYVCVLIGVAGAAFDFYASILLHIVVCTDRQSIFYAFLSLHFITTATIV